MKYAVIVFAIALSACNIFQTQNSGSTATCGNGVLEAGEFCDGDCPQSCNDGNVCSMDELVGSPGSCTARCTAIEISACADDGCCATGCSKDDDVDCANCGNGQIDGAETCDGDCPTSCDDSNACTRDTRMGSDTSCNVFCTNDPILTCADDDGCCPSGCTVDTDTDCADCGDGEVGANETCDRAIESGDGSCNFDCAGDPDVCFQWVQTGSETSCDVACAMAETTACANDDGCCPDGCNEANDNDCDDCGNGVIDSGETCDPMASGDDKCPSSCDDDDACTTDTKLGDSDYCDVVCQFSSPITACVDGDGCCPSTCTELNDADCNLPKVGDACTEDDQCPVVAGERKCEKGVGWPGGYCSGECSGNADCPSGSRCFSEDCHIECVVVNDCRTGYSCLPGGGGMVCRPD